MNQTVEHTVIEMFARIVRIPSSEVRLEADLFADYGLDSLQAVKLLSQLEVEFDVLLPDHEVQKMSTLGDVIQVVDRARHAGGQS